MQANITMSLLQDTPTFDGQDFSRLEDWLMDIKTTTDILTRSHTCLAKVKTHSLARTVICEALQAGTLWDTRISSSNSLSDKATRTVPLHCLFTY